MTINMILEMLFVVHYYTYLDISIKNDARHFEMRAVVENWSCDHWKISGTNAVRYIRL
jgi:hypothetical protein